MAQVADAEIERWPLGEPFRTLPRMQALTLEVIMRTVFGVQDEERKARLGAALSEMLGWATDPRRMALLAALGPHRTARLRLFRRMLEPSDELIYDEIRERRRGGRPGGARRHLSMLLQARHEDGSAMTDDGAARRAHDAAGGRPRDHRHRAGLGAGALVRHPEALARLREEADEGHEYADAVCKETLRLRPIRSRSWCAASRSRWRSAAGCCRPA